jgi:hypothetical protein
MAWPDPRLPPSTALTPLIPIFIVITIGWLFRPHIATSLSDLIEFHTDVYYPKPYYAKRTEREMVGMKDLNPQFITNEAGERISVVLPISKFQELLEDIEDLAVVAERREEPTISHETLLTELKRDGLI